VILLAFFYLLEQIVKHVFSSADIERVSEIEETCEKHSIAQYIYHLNQKL
jgi:hypothetical protein